MTRRNGLRSQLYRAWSNTINTSYCAQFINSEHGLLTYFCAALLKEFDDMGLPRRIFIEPKLSLGSSKARRHPDIVICNSINIIGVVELKYVPRGRPTYAKDMETLSLVSNSSDDLKISNDRFRGVTQDNRSYPLSDDAVLCWAGVHSGDKLDLRNSIQDASFNRRFLHLSALTFKKKHPTVIKS